MSAPRKFGSRQTTRAPAVTAAAAAAVPSVFKNFTQKDRLTVEFQIAPTKVEYANTLRRAILTEVESVGFRADILSDGSTADVSVLKNSTPMSNEMLAHRIGLLPIHVANPLEWNPDEYTFELNIKNDSSDPRDVTAADIQVHKQRGPEEDPLLVPSSEFFYPNPVSQSTALLAVLKGRTGSQEPESLHFQAKATVGIGRENARFIPVTQCAYRYTLDKDSERQKEHFEAWLNSHKKVAPADLETNPTRKAELQREFATMEVQRCYLVDEAGEPFSFDFVVESVGVLNPTYIVTRALQALQEKCMKYMTMDTGDLPETVRVRPADARMKGFDFLFQHEDHTLGNLLQTWMDIHHMGTTAETTTTPITFVGYKVPHPLKDEMLLRVGVEDGKELTARQAVAEAARGCLAMFKGWEQSWAAVAGSAAIVAPSATAREALQRAAQARRFQGMRS
jgi:DNA-directed RNA polymerase subunit D